MVMVRSRGSRPHRARVSKNRRVGRYAKVSWFTRERSTRQSRNVSKSASSESMSSDRSLRREKSIGATGSGRRAEQHGLGGETGTERHGAAARSRRHRPASHGVKHEQNRGRRHIAEMTQDRARGGKRRLIEIERV